MRILITNILRGVKNRLFQYIGIIFLLIIIVATMTGLYSSSERVQTAFLQVEEHSGVYDYHIKIEKINDFKDVDDAVARIKKVMKGEFDPSLPDYQEIINQIDQISNTDIQNNILPNSSKGLNEKLKTYLLNWGVNYKAILINDILNHDLPIDPTTSGYQIKKSFLKSFDYQSSHKLFFSFEDAFYSDSSTASETTFNFSPKRNGVDEVYLVQGRKPIADDEVVINPTFAQDNGISLGSQFEFVPGVKLTVVGFGYAYYGILPALSPQNLNASPKNTTPVFTTRAWLNDYLFNNSNYLTRLTTPFFLKVGHNDAFFPNKLERILSKSFNFNYGSVVISNGEDLRSGMIKQSFQMQNIIYSAISFIVMLAAVFIVLSYVTKEIEIQKKQIGLIKALGYNNNEISFGFTILFFLISLLATSVGFILGLPLQMRFNTLGDFGFFLPLSSMYFSWICLVLGVIVSTAIFTIASYLQAYGNLAKDPLLLIYDRPSNRGSKWLAILKKPFNYWKFKPRLAVSFALKSIGKVTLIFFIFVFATFLLMFENVAIDIFSNKLDNFYSFVNKDVYYYDESINMYRFNSPTQVQDQIYDWILQKDLDPNKAIKSDTFHIDTEQKYKNLVNLMMQSSYKGYYSTSAEVNLLYHNTQDPNDPNKCFNYIKAGQNYIPDDQAQQLCAAISKFFNMLTAYSGIDPKVQSLPGFAIGMNVLNSKYYPNLEFKAASPASWEGHDQGPLTAKRLSIYSLYNSANPNNPVTWKKWFNMKEEKGRDIDYVFNTTHILGQEKVSYVDGFGNKKTEKAYVLPAVISKALATLNKYKVGSQALVIVNASGRFVPIVFDVKGITISNLDTPGYYTNIDDLRRAVSYVDNQGQPLEDAFNNFYSKDSSSIFPLNSINIAQPNNDYSRQGLQNNWTLINKAPMVLPLIKQRLGQIFSSIKNIITISKWLTIIALAFVLIIIVNMILDNNLLIIAMMKSLGYRINEINLLIIGSYIVTLIVAFIFGTILSYVTWGIILWIVTKFTSTIFLLPISVLTIFVSFVLIFGVILVGYGVGLYFIKFKPVTSLLQSD